MLAFVDEFGNHSFKFEEQGSHFIITAILINEEDLVETQATIVQIRRKLNFQSSELKSSRVAGNTERRLKVLTELNKLPITILSVVIDKRELTGIGFRFKKTFYKYLNNILYRELFQANPKLKIVVDEFGRNDYMVSFKDYVKKKNSPSLWDETEFQFEKSHENDLIQVADFYAGSLGYVFDASKSNNDSDKIHQVILAKNPILKMWPNVQLFDEIIDSDGINDTKIRQICIHKANHVLCTLKSLPKDEKPELVDQENLLHILLLWANSELDPTYHKTSELIKSIGSLHDRNINEEYFRSKVIGGLRDRGVIIASSKKGYKIPISLSEINSYVKHTNNVILPMLKRLKQASEVIQIGTNGGEDILSGFAELKKITKLVNEVTRVNN